MASKRKSKKKTLKHKNKPVKSKRSSRELVTVKAKQSRNRKSVPRKSRKRPIAMSKRAKKRKISVEKQLRKPPGSLDGAAFVADGRRSRSGEQAGDLQGLSRRESADSESVDELLEEGNAFEADAVLGVENADLEDAKQVRTHEVPEDDVPEEYLDKE